MNGTSIAEIRRALRNLSNNELIEMTIRMAKFKKENKELASYLLFDAYDEKGFIERTQKEIDTLFRGLKNATPYLQKKGIRKALTFTTQQIKYSTQKRTEVELLIYFCEKMKKEIRFRNNLTLDNLYNRLMLRLGKAYGALHEDLRLDYADRLDKLH